VQLAFGMEIPIAHTVELLDWAYGGPVPRGLEALADQVQEVPEPRVLQVQS
jgi:glycolate oxidase iron-sulfur subunit